MLNLILAWWLVLAPGTVWFASATSNAGSSTANSSVGTINWGAASSAAGGLNSTFAQVSSSTPNAISYYLRLSSYTFSIPAGATINGVKVTIRAGSVGDSLFLTGPCTSPTLNYYRVRLVNHSSVIGTHDKASANTLTNDGVFSDVFGGSADTWGGEASSIDWNNANSGVVVAFQWSASGSSNCTAVVDYVPIEITYTPAGGNTMPRRTIISQGKVRDVLIEREFGYNSIAVGMQAIKGDL